MTTAKSSFGPRTSIIYITAGALICVWTAVWYFAFARGSDGTLSRNTTFWLAGFFLTGMTLLVVGILLGKIGRSARKADLAPKDATPTEKATVAAGGPVVMANGVPMVPAAMPGQVMPNAMPMQAAPQPYVPGVTRQ